MNRKHYIIKKSKCVQNRNILFAFMSKNKNNIYNLISNGNHFFDKIAYDYYIGLCKKFCKSDNYKKTLLSEFVNFVKHDTFILGVILKNSDGTKYHFGDLIFKS